MNQTALAAHDVKPEKRLTLLYLGIRVGLKKQKVHKWFNIEGIPNEGKSLDLNSDKFLCPISGSEEAKMSERYMAYGGKNIARGASIGQIWSIVAKDETSVIPSTAKYIELWGSKEDVHEWLAASVAAEATIKEAKRPAKDKTSFANALTFLAPISRTYGRANSAGKAAILQRVITYIMRGK
jgi:hypothetical protein